ncbi:MAG: HAMP domain-containing histidine kinase [Alphaproteobacteria bacterium]|jgi:signal transduction histidine kinase|nr:HAMP domain-containing histidine kinase [Alphaproteobacteria bacterium]
MIGFWHFLLSWPLRIRVPLIVTALTVTLAVAISQFVLTRLADSQEVNLHRLAGAYLHGVSTAIIPHVIRQDIWETYDALERSGARYEGLNARSVIVSLEDQTVLAASNPSRFPVSSPVPSEIIGRFPGGQDLVIDENNPLGWVRRSLSQDDVVIGNLYAEFDLTALMRERREVLVTLIVFNSVLTLIFAAAGYLVVRHMVQPVSVLGHHMERLKSGSLVRIPDHAIKHQGAEFVSLFRRFNSMVNAINDREELAQRLSDEEKLALLGKLASGMAHEVNNPLGGMMNAVDTLKKHGADPKVRETALGLIDRGLRGIRRVVRATLVTYRGAKGTTDSENLSKKDVDDLKFLVQHEVLRRQLRIEWLNELPDDLMVDGGAIRQATLNLLLNACEASPVGSIVQFHSHIEDNFLVVSVEDDGPGLPSPIEKLFKTAKADTIQPIGTTGLGTWTAARLVAKLEGEFALRTGPDGTYIEFRVPIGEEEMLNAVA